jgi:class 3 adenylate cyclase
MGVRDSFQNTFSCYLEDASRQNATQLMASKSMDSAVSFSESTSRELVPQYSIQRILRPLYQKGEPQRPDIGDHPDFKHLLGTDLMIKCPITTLFMDIESSTRLSLLYPLEDVYRIKNAFIRVAMEIVKSFNGHVHRIMGDAVMAYFGGSTVAPETGIIDGLNCASVLCYFVEQSVVPKLNSMGYKEPFGIRVGVDFGKEADVLWRSYGYPGMEEVTATSFFVDVASKLQHAAGRNQIMIGESIRSFIDFPDELLSVKSITSNGNKVPIPYLQPNHTDARGNPINYKQYELNWNSYLKHSPLAQFDPTYQKNADGIRISADIFNERGGQFEGTYSSTSRFLPKGKSIKFSMKLPYMPMLPYTIKFKVENHGVDARTKGGEMFGSHVTEKTVTTIKEHDNISHWEETAYRGLHYMIIEVHTHLGLSHRTQFGVYIE